MKVGLIAPLINRVPPLSEGGTERVVADLSAALDKLGCQVTVFAADGSRVAGTLSSQGVAVSERGDPPPGLPAAMEAAMLARVRAVADRFDVLHFHTEFMHAPVFADCLGRTLTTVHWRADQADRAHWMRAFPDIPLAAISASQGSQFSAGRMMGVVHHGIDADRYRLVPEHRHRLAFIGRMTDQKRPDRAIEIARRAGLPLDLAGGVDVGNPGYFASHVEPLLGQGCRWLGKIGDAEKQRLLGGATALVFPIDWPEPFGLVMIEAMACGTPVIAWPLGAAPEVIEHGVTGFLVGSVEEAAAAVRDASRLDRARIRARFEARFTADRMARDYLAIYRRLIADQSSDGNQLVSMS